MSTINLLSSKIYNRIAAGEVVERPYSVVKELVENSIDASAKNITIEIAGGGVSSIRVYDDGEGIAKKELKKALLPHATSKISNVDDLDKIMTLGFRGEALASIASVSKITIISKPKTQENGAKINAFGGEIGEIEDCASPNGTEITVRNLFYNTPAREKFLKTERGEESDITNLVSKFILGNPNLAIKYIANDKIIYQSYGENLSNAMTTIYPKNILDDCYFVEGKKNGISVSGYIGKQYFSKPNRTYQTIFLNGRYITNQTVSAAITNAYAPYLMKRQYPFYVLSLSMPVEIVDVNVHPNKTDVRFSDNRVIYSAVYSIISKVLDGAKDAVSIIKEKTVINVESNDDYVRHNANSYTEISTENSKNDYLNEKYGLKFCDSEKSVALSIEYKDVEIKQENDAIDIFAENKAYLESLEKKAIKPESLSQTSIEIRSELKYIGQVLNTYLIFDDGSDIYFVDQHAAHERMLYDKFIDKINSSAIDVQPLLIPYVENVNSIEYDFLIKNEQIFNDMGIELSSFGENSIKISALPTCLAEMNIKLFLSEILNDINGLKSITLKDLLKEKLAQKACKSAIKSGDKITDAGVDEILNAIKKNIGLKCPHGRPVVAKITRTEIDKWFKRIV